MRAGFGLNQLDIDAHAVSRPLDAALQHIANVQFAADLLQINVLALKGEGCIASDHESATDARQIRRQAFRDPVDEILLFRVAADIGEWQNDDREARRVGSFRSQDRRRLRSGGRGLADLERIDPDRIGDVLELSLAQVGDRQIKPSLDLAIGVLGKADRPRVGDALQARGDVDAVAHQVAVALLNDVAEVNADAELDASFRWQTSVALDHSVLHLDRAPDRVHYATELNDVAVAGALNDAPMMRGDGGIDEIATEAPQARQSAILVRRGESAVTDNVGDQDCSELARFPHGAPSGRHSE